MQQLRDRQIRLVHELMYQIKVSEAMTCDVFQFSPQTTFREIQQSMKENRFSGAPIVENGNRLVGIVSIDDIITAFDSGHIDERVEGYMTRNVITIPQNYSVIAASNIFERSLVGRLPVVEKPGSDRLVGILTYGDIMSHLIMVVNSIAERFEEHDREKRSDVHVEHNIFRYALAPDNFDMAGNAATDVKRKLRESGVAPDIVRHIAVICYEAEMNVIIHSLGGYLEVELFDDRVRMTAVDEGPGIPDVEQAMKAGYTTANEKVRALGFGAGMGLVNIKRCANEFKLTSDMEHGTMIEAVVYLKDEEAK